MSDKTSSSKDGTKKIDLKNASAKKATAKPTTKKATPKSTTKKVAAKPATKKAPSEAKTKKPVKKRGIVTSIFYGIFSVTSNIFLLILLVCLIAGAFVCSYVLEIVNDIPEIDPTTIAESLSENSIIVDQNGIVLETLYGDAGMRTKVEYEDIGQNMINAIVAIEDKTFFEHTGFNYVRLVGAALESVRSGDGPVGTSSITQQLAKNLYLTNERALERKIKEAYYAILLERSLTKEQILWAYLNKIALGMNANGVQSASMLYFSKDAKDLSLVESVIIAGIPKSPAAYAPLTRLPKSSITEDHMIIDDTDDQYTLVFNPNSQDRYESVLKAMYNNQMITEAEYMLRNEDISTYINPTVDQNNLISSYFGDLVKDDAAKALAEVLGVTPAEAEHMLYSRGYIIESTIDFDIQETIEGIYESIILTNEFDSATKSAVMKFQRDNDLTQDGSAGSNTLRLIVEQTSATEEDFTLPHLNIGTYHNEVITLKEALKELGLLSNDGLFPRATVIFDNNGNIVLDVTNKTELYKFSNKINDEKQFIINNEDYYYDDYDNLVLLRNKGLKFYQQENGVQVVMNDLFTYEEGSEEKDVIDGRTFYNISGLYKYQGGDIMVPREYTTKVDSNLVIDKSLFADHPDFFIEADNGDLLVDSSNYFFVERGVIQPQSAFVLMDQHTGEIKAMIGGRDSTGQNIFNRATTPQQPGSSIKPIGPYTVAIASKQFTAATVIDDIPSFLDDKDPERRWPYNWYETTSFKYRGRMTLRQGIAQSINVLAVKLAQEVGVENIIDHLDNLGITSLQKVNDGNGNSDLTLSSVSLGGMTNGISPLELTAAYATYANQGVYVEPISFTRITDLAGNVIVENKPERRVVLDEQVAYIIQDMMIGAITPGVGASSSAYMPEMTMAGKTGTTSDKRDALFVGYTPYYTAAVWFGNDVKLKMDEGSVKAAKFWSIVMQELHEDLEDVGFPEPEGLQRVSVDRVSGKRPGELSASDPDGSQVYRELFLPGTAPTEVDDAHVLVTICLDNEKHQLATEYCQTTEERVLRTRLEEYDPNEVLDKYENPILPRDYLFTVPHEDCTLHTSETISNDGKGAKVVDAIAGIGVVFIRDYNLLLEDGTFKFIPEGSTISIDYEILLPNGDIILKEEYNMEYIVNPEVQIQKIYDMTQESINNEAPPEDGDAPE